MKKRNQDRKREVKAYSMILQFGLVMIVSIGMCTALGIWLDGKLGTNYLSVIGFFIGAISGGNGIYKLAKQFDDDEKEN